MTDYTYDIETYPNVFTCYIGNTSTNRCSSFEISNRKDEREKFFKYLKMLKMGNHRMVGFNNIAFDYPVIHYLIKNPKASVKQIYEVAMEIINSDDRFKYSVWQSDWYVEQLDLYKIHHFDNVARATSLKMLEFNMRSDNIEDLPFEVGKYLSSDEIDTLLIYNKHDMVETTKFYRESKDHIRFREELTKKYNKSFMNHNDTKIGKDYFIMELEKSKKGICYNGRKPRQTKRNKINLDECIFDYVKFERPEFNAVLEWLKNTTITETKGVFTDILESDLGSLANYCELRTKRQRYLKKPTDQLTSKLKAKHPKGWWEESKLKSGATIHWWNWKVADNLNVIVDGFKFDFGTGGIHGSLDSSIVESDDKYIVHDEDVASYYPNLAISNRVYPEHIGELFCDIYKDVYNQRKKYPKGSTENAMLKLALNGVYGDSNNKYSPFYDPKYTMTITINGQLSLCMLAEKLMTIGSLSMVQVNTDGLTYKVGKDDYDKALNICKEWEKITKLSLEGIDYKAMYIRDVNNYIAITTGGKIKRKGAYQYEGLGWHQNHSQLIVPYAAEQYLINNKPIESTICDHENIYDFMLRTKVPRSSKLVLVKDNDEIKLQNICRYYVSNNGGELFKIMPPKNKEIEANVYEDEFGERYYATTKVDNTKYSKKYKFIGKENIKCNDRRISINAGLKVKPCNNINDYDGDINYKYYIDEAIKLVQLKSLTNN